MQARTIEYYAKEQKRFAELAERVRTGKGEYASLSPEERERSTAGFERLVAYNQQSVEEMSRASSERHARQ